MSTDIKKLKELALAATPGPWSWWTSNSTLRLTGADGKDGGVLHGYVHGGCGDVSCSDANRAFIEAANPAVVAELAKEIERLRAAHAGGRTIANDPQFRRLAERWSGAAQSCDHRTRTIVAPQEWERLADYVNAWAGCVQPTEEDA